MQELTCLKIALNNFQLLDIFNLESPEGNDLDKIKSI